MLIYQSLWIASKNDMKCPWKSQKQFHWNGFFCCFDQLFAGASPFYGAINDPTKKTFSGGGWISQTGAPIPIYLGQKAIIWQDFCRKLHENASLDTRLPCIRQWLCPQILKKKAFDTLPLLSGGRILEYDFLPARHDVVYFRTVSGIFVQVTVVVHHVLKWRFYQRKISVSFFQRF